MTPEKKQEINRVIAGAMGWTCLNGKLGIPPGKKYETSSLHPIPNPVDSISDAFKARTWGVGLEIHSRGQK